MTLARVETFKHDLVVLFNKHDLVVLYLFTGFVLIIFIIGNRSKHVYIFRRTGSQFYNMRTVFQSTTNKGYVNVRS